MKNLVLVDKNDNPLQFYVDKSIHPEIKAIIKENGGQVVSSKNRNEKGVINLVKPNFNGSKENTVSVEYVLKSVESGKLENIKDHQFVQKGSLAEEQQMLTVLADHLDWTGVEAVNDLLMRFTDYSRTELLEKIKELVTRKGKKRLEKTQLDAKKKEISSYLGFSAPIQNESDEVPSEPDVTTHLAVASKSFGRKSVGSRRNIIRKKELDKEPELPAKQTMRKQSRSNILKRKSLIERFSSQGLGESRAERYIDNTVQSNPQLVDNRINLSSSANRISDPRRISDISQRKKARKSLENASPFVQYYGMNRKDAANIAPLVEFSQSHAKSVNPWKLINDNSRLFLETAQIRLKTGGFAKIPSSAESLDQQEPKKSPSVINAVPESPSEPEIKSPSAEKNTPESPSEPEISSSLVFKSPSAEKNAPDSPSKINEELRRKQPARISAVLAKNRLSERIVPFIGDYENDSSSEYSDDDQEINLSRMGSYHDLDYIEELDDKNFEEEWGALNIEEKRLVDAFWKEMKEFRREHPEFTEYEIKLALFMSNASFYFAKRILESNFRVDDLDQEEERGMVFEIRDDFVLRNFKLSANQLKSLPIRERIEFLGIVRDPKKLV